MSFAELWAPVASGACAILASCLPYGPEASVLSDLRENLTLRLSQVAEGAVWEYFNAHRTLNELIEARLNADQGGCRRILYFRAIEQLRADGLAKLSAEYPVLRRHLSATVASWLAASRELLVRVERDRESLKEKLNVPASARLVGVKTGISDPHREGRSAAILSFSIPGTAELSVVYKPRDLRIEAAYHQLISQVSATTPGLALLRSAVVLPLDGYGYVEFIAHEVCSSEEQLEQFYRNAGRLTAILYVLGCNDCHNENVIAHRDQLILIDAETLLQGVPRRAIPDRTTARLSLEARLSDSVVRIGLLPHWFFIAGERTPRDVSALGIEPPATEHETYTGWSALNTDGMVTGPATRQARLPTSSPVGTGSPNRLSDFADKYCAAFRHQLEAIAAEKLLWIGEDGRLNGFRDLHSRFIRRPTWIYLWVRDQLLGAAALRDEVAQCEVLARLDTKRGNLDVHDAAVLIAEQTQLSNLDVPFFQHSVEGCDLVLDNGEVAMDFFIYSGLDAARRRIGSLDSESIQLQLALVEGLMSAKTRRAHREQRRDPLVGQLPVCTPSAEERLEAATHVGNLLINTSFDDHSGHVEWLGIDSAADLERSCYGPLGATLYSGRAGIALFLARLADARSDRRAGIYRQAATSACADLIQLLESTTSQSDKRRWWRDQPLGLAGSGGQLLAGILLHKQLPEMHRAVVHGLPGLLEALDPELICTDEDLDIIFGCSGLIGPLLRIRTPTAMELARIAGDRLVERQEAGGGWIVPALAAKALTGFAHGASGAAAALAKLAAATTYRPYGDAATRALKYERALYNADERNWPDLRAVSLSMEPSFMLSWCHGAPGIALARLCLKSTPLWDEEAAQDLELALSATTDATRHDHSLCCGRLGRAAILRAAHDRSGERRWFESAVHLEAQALAQMRSDAGYSFGDVLGIFQGAAGNRS